MVASSNSHHFTPLPSEDIHVTVIQEEARPSVLRSMDDTLDVLLAKVGYGRFHTTLLILCGFGWLADNMWLQTVAIILPRVQEHFDVDDKWIGTLSSALFTGMMLGSFFWGSYSDSKGRRLPYTLTLAITSVFGILSSFAFSFWSLCVLLFLLGFGVGGNMPTDGALYLEFLPRQYHYLLTFMSVFFSFGAVFASILGYIILPSTSCPEPTVELPLPTCDLSTQNRGWRIMLFSVGIVTLLMLAARSFCLRLPETPKFLLNNNKHQETIIVLQDIAKMNGTGYVDIQASDLHHDGNRGAHDVDPDDEDDDDYDTSEHAGLLNNKSKSTTTTLEMTDTSSSNKAPPPLPPNLSTNTTDSEDIVMIAASTATETTTHHRSSRQFDEEELDASTAAVRALRFLSDTTTATITTTTATTTRPPTTTASLDTTNSWSILMSDKWRLTLFLTWGIWTFTAMSFTMFNVFLPKYLETLGFEGEAAPTRKDVYLDYMIYSIAGVPGSVMASFMIETRLGRKGTMALSAFGSAIALFLFSIIDSRATMLISSSSVSFLATLLYAVIYGYTPEVFDTAVRGTAVGTASGLGRIAGIGSPIVSGILLTINTALPLYVSVAGFVIVGVCILLLPYETRSSAK